MSEATKGYDLEIRAHRLAWHFGYFCRRRINLYSDEGNLLTDIDVIGARFDSKLNPDYILIETKSEKGFASILKLKGLLEYFKSNSAYIIRPNITPDIIRFAESLDINALHTSRVDEIEDNLGIPKDKWVYSYSHRNDYRIDEYIKILKKEKHDREITLGNYFWEEKDAFYIVKLLIDSIDHLYGVLKKEGRVEVKKAVQYLILEHVILFIVGILRCGNELYKYPTHQRKKIYQERLISGKLSFREKEELLDKFYSFLKNYAKTMGVKMELKRRDLSLMPNYEEALYELLNKFVDNSRYAKSIPLVMDLYLSAYIASEDIGKEIIQSELNLGGEMDVYLHLISSVISFLFKSSPDFITGLLK